jgi:hypothetical protein
MADFGQALANIEMPQINEDELNGFANFLEQGFDDEMGAEADAWSDLHEFLFRWRNDLDGQQRQQQRAFFQVLANRALVEARNLVGLNNPPVPVHIRPQVPDFLDEGFDDEDPAATITGDEAQELEDSEDERTPRSLYGGRGDRITFREEDIPPMGRSGRF